jgi:nucleotide-binding universal stress UspA family protein
VVIEDTRIRFYGLPSVASGGSTGRCTRWVSSHKKGANGMLSEWGTVQIGRDAADETPSERDGRRVLVALDGATSDAVLPDAVNLARCLGGSLLLAHVMPPGSVEPTIRIARDRLERLVQSARDHGVGAATILLEGEPTEQITGYLLGNPVAALALGSRGDWGNDGGLYGSVADAVLRQSPVPVLVRRAPAGPKQAPPAPFRQVVVPLDGSRLAERAVPQALTLAGASGGRVLFVHVVQDRRPFVGGGGSTLVGRELQAAGEYLTAIRERFLQVGVPMEVTVRLGPPAETIRWVLREMAADLVVMATHGRSGVRREHLGSVALDVLQADVPLLLHPPTAVRPWDDGSSSPRDLSAGRAIAV